MARYSDASSDCNRWTNAKLIRELRRLTDFTNASFNLPVGFIGRGLGRSGDTEAIIEATRLYRETWLNPIIAEIERRFVK